MDDLALEGLPLLRTPVQARSRQKLADGLAAAERLLVTEGAEAITLPRVAAEAGLSVGALYQYLPDRDAILCALVARYHARVEGLIDAVITAAASAEKPADPVGFVIGAVAEIYREEAPARSLRQTAASGEIDAARVAHKRRMSGKVAALLRAVGVETAGRDAGVVARVAFIAADAVMHDAFTAVGREQDELLAELEDLLRAYLPLG